VRIEAQAHGEGTFAFFLEGVSVITHDATLNARSCEKGATILVNADDCLPGLLTFDQMVKSATDGEWRVHCSDSPFLFHPWDCFEVLDIEDGTAGRFALLA
jgi:hypothetical protein